MRKKLLPLLLSVLLLCGCAPIAPTPRPGALTVVCAAFPEYCWARAVVGDASEVDITLLMNNGVDAHSYQPSVQDIVAAARCDLLVYNGGSSEAWLADTAAQYRTGKATVRLMEVLSGRLLMEERGSVLQADSAEDAPEVDEHVWLSLRNAQICVTALGDALSALDPGHADQYVQNAAAYNKLLDALDGDFSRAIEGAAARELVFADRFPFLYLLNDYGIAHTAAFPGCSAESEASFSTVIGLTERLNTLNLSAVLVMEGSNDALARAIIEGSDDPAREILVLNSMQSVTKKALATGANYLDIMRENLAVLKQVMGVVELAADQG
ncbi:MAG: metal ABC transporter substrate-binding protein [Firmicutes bacterium]|nr:metal ABC transporter substrate-binding protein [Bacillota bacterium]